MPRYIDADALKDVIQQHDYPLSDKLNSIGNGMFTLGIFQAIDQMPTVSPDEVRGVGEWTSVEERLPDVAEKVLTYNGDFVSENWLCTVASKVGRINVWAYSEGFVTHWMPLPKAPKEDAK